MDILQNKFNEISIHAPARGATVCRGTFYKRIKISIHAPARGATALRDTFDFDVAISIHAPARGATSFHFSTSSIM